MDIAEIAADPHLIARDMIVAVDEPGFAAVRIAGVPVKMTATPGGVHARAPFLGEHTRARLIEAGLTHAKTDALIPQRAATEKAMP